jgi:hypothetical protein
LSGGEKEEEFKDLPRHSIPPAMKSCVVSTYAEEIAVRVSADSFSQYTSMYLHPIITPINSRDRPQQNTTQILISIPRSAIIPFMIHSIVSSTTEEIKMFGTPGGD